MRHFDRLHQTLLRLLLSCALALALFGVAACEEDDDDDDPETEQLYFAYVANTGGLDISGFAIDASTGEAAELEGSPYNGYTSMGSLASPSPGFVVLAHGSNTQVIVKRRNTDTGALKSISNGVHDFETFTSLDMSVNPDTGIMYTTDNSPDILAFALNDDGEVEEVADSPFANGTSDPMGAHALSPDGEWLYTVLQSGGATNVFAVDPDTGALTDANSSANNANARLAGVDSTGRVFALTHDGSPESISTLLILDGGALDDIAAYNFDDDPNQVIDLEFHPTDDYVYVTTDLGIYAYAVTPTTGELDELAGSPFQTSPDPRHLAFTPDGEYLLVTDGLAALLQVYEVEADGSLTEAPGSPYDTGSGPEHVIVVAPEE